MTTPEHQTATARLRRPSGVRSLRLGDTKVTHVPDGAVQLSPRGWLPATTDEDWAAHSDYVDDTGHLVAGIGGLLVEQGDRALLIDTGFGPQSFPAEPGSAVGAIQGGALLDNLVALGRRPEEIEAVAFTHLHTDHIGWAVHVAPGSDQPAFTRADYLVVEPEWSQRHLLEADGTSKEALAVLAPKVRTVADGQEIFPGVRVQLVPGHTPGHAAYVITSSGQGPGGQEPSGQGSGGQRLIAFGDALHSPVQIGHPEWSAAPDHDPGKAADFRRRLVEELQEPGTIGFGIHFADVVFGRVQAEEGRAVWHPVDDGA
ncbi:MBL fold metallo-hydrolase [Streptomyces sp. NPDC047525]|uniref:MBL fold metallo-hydrolase n=1 Tax=Streptomyces sp. NPDC047525 TaxID=3155264 RepID=UPI0033F0653C